MINVVVLGSGDTILKILKKLNKDKEFSIKAIGTNKIPDNEIISFAKINQITIVESLDDCFGYRDTGFDEELHISVTGAYDTIECPETVKLSRDERTDVVTCKITGIDVTNLGAAPSEITITMDEFAYEDEIPSTTIWLEP